MNQLSADKLMFFFLTSVGKLVYDNGEFYEGDWVRGKRHGKGTYVYADGTCLICISSTG